MKRLSTGVKRTYNFCALPEGGQGHHVSHGSSKCRIQHLKMFEEHPKINKGYVQP